MRQPVWLRRLTQLVKPYRLGIWAVAFACGLGWAAWGEGADKSEKPVGHPLAPQLMGLLEQEIRTGLKDRGIESNMNRWRRYAAMKLDSTAGAYTNSEITGNCRLRWYDQLLRNPLKAPAEAEKFTRELHQAIRGNHRGLEQVMVTAREKMDCTQRQPRSFTSPKSPDEAMRIVEKALAGAQTNYAEAMSPLSRGELGELWNNLYAVLVSQNRVGHTIQDRVTGRRMCDLLERMDRDRIYEAADALVPLANPELLKQLTAIPDQGDVKVEGVAGSLVREIVTPAGKIVVGGKRDNTYSLDQMKDVNVVIDLGGDDTYLEGTCNVERPVLIVIDLAGNDTYRGSNPGIQGGAILGASMWIDREGNDTYRASDLAQGSCVGGVGILIDYAGDDRYLGVRRVQGQAVGGLGMLLDRQGNDDYHGAMWAQGFGGPLGFAVLDDLDGKDHYYSGGAYRNSYYPETPGYEGWGQGVGAGIRQVACGGIGTMLDGGGDDTYEFDYMSHGGGYWLGTGFARDFGGNDRRLGATLKAYDGGQRTQESFQRFSNGFGCHYASGFCFDDHGNDTYNGTIMGLAFGWDLAVGVLCDFAGNDRYEATGGGTQGNGAQGSIGILFDYDGDDAYLGYGQGFASSSISYHPASECGGNFSFVIDYGGKDSYGCGVQDNSINSRGTEGGFLIDRPKRGETSPREAAQPIRKGAMAGS